MPRTRDSLLATLEKKGLTLVDALQRHRYFLAYCIAISLLAFGFELFNVALSIDEEIFSHKKFPVNSWLKMDRWGMAIMTFIFQSSPPLPYFHLLLAIAINLLSFLACLRIWRVSPGLATYLAAIFALTSPLIAFVYQFNMANYGYYLGMLLAVLGAGLFAHGRPTWPRMLYSTLLMVGSLSLYQSTLFAAPVVYLFYLLSHEYIRQNSIRKVKEILRTILLFAACLMSAVAAHEVISTLLRKIFQVSGRYHTIDRFYAGSFLQEYDPVFVIKEIIAQLIGHRWYIGYATGMVVTICLFILLRRLWKIAKINNRVLGLLVLAGAILSPFIFILVTGHIWPGRTMMALPLMIAGLVCLATPLAGRMLKMSLLALSLFCLTFYIGANTKLFYSDYVSWQNDRLLANRIVNMLEINYGDQLDSDDPLPIVFSGTPKQELLPTRVREETFGGSMLSKGEGGSNRIVAMLRLMGVNYFRTPSGAERRQGRQLLKSMHDWPAAESTRIENGIVLVKFGPQG